MALLVAGCGSSPPTQYYALDPVTPAQASTAIEAKPVKIIAVHIPPSLDRQEMVREGTSHEVDVSDQNRWSAPLDQMIQRVLTEDLLRRLPSGLVELPQEPGTGSVGQIVIDILRFEEVGNNDVVFEGSWSLLRNGSDKAAFTRHITLSAKSASSTYKDQVGAMSRLLGSIADQIVSSLASPEPSGKAAG